MKVIQIIVLFSIVIGTYNSIAQQIEWQNTIGGSKVDELNSISQTLDKGYILGGSSFSNISGDKNENSQGQSDYWVIKLDSLGNIQWQNTIGGNGVDRLMSISQCDDGGYILGGNSDSDISGDKSENSQGNHDYWVIKLDLYGNILWQNTIGGNGLEYLFSISQTNDGGYIVGGESTSSISGDKTENSFGQTDYWIVKLDSIGNIQWQNDIGGNSYDRLHSVSETNDGGFILGGASASDISGDKTENSKGIFDYWVLKLDSLGYIQWQNTIGGFNWDELLSVNQTFDGGYILGGYSDSDISVDKTENCWGYPDYWVIKLDSIGNIEWQNTIGGSSYDYLNSVIQTANDSGYLLGGYSYSNISGDKMENSQGGYDYWVIKLDSIGNIQWQNTIGGNFNDELNSVMQTLDKGYILGGFSFSGISGDKTENCQGDSDYWIIKLNSDTLTYLQLPNSTQFNINLNPVVTSDIINLVFSSPWQGELTIQLYNSMGKYICNLFESAINTEKLNLNFNMSFLPSGIYFIHIEQLNHAQLRFIKID